MSLSQLAGICFIAAYVCFVAFLGLAFHNLVKYPTARKAAVHRRDVVGRHYRR